MTLTIFDFVKIIKKHNGKAYYVGGYVRDKILNKPSHDKDILITGISQNDFEKSFPQAVLVGKSFPVYIVNIDNVNTEVAFARTERKNGKGYKGFAVNFNKDITLEEDLFRRDTTMNSLAMDIETNEIIDLYGGINHIKNKEIHAVSHHFSEDPIRSLRAARQSAQFGFTISEKTLSMMKQCKEELKQEPKERIFSELEKALNTENPSMFFKMLKEANLLDVTFPEIYYLINKSQPILHHPEGDAFNHTMNVLDAVSIKSTNSLVRFSALMHDIGKITTPEDNLPHHYNHDIAGVDIIDALPNVYLKNWKNSAKFVSRYHMTVISMKNYGKIVRVLDELKRNPIGINGFSLIVAEDSTKIPWFLQEEVYYKYVKSKINLPANISPVHLPNFIHQEKIKILKKIYKEQN